MPKKTLIFNETDDTGLYSFYFSDWTFLDTVDRKKAESVVDNYLSVTCHEYYLTKQIIKNLIEIINNCDEALSILSRNKDEVSYEYYCDNQEHFIVEKTNACVQLEEYLHWLWATREWIKEIYEVFCKGDYDY